MGKGIKGRKLNQRCNKTVLLAGGKKTVIGMVSSNLVKGTIWNSFIEGERGGKRRVVLQIMGNIGY